MGWRPDFMDPDNYLWPFGHSSQSGNMGIFYDDSEMDYLLRGGRAITTPVHGSAREGIYEQIQDRWAAKAPTIPLLQGVDLAAVWDGVHGVNFSPLGMLPYFTMSQYRILEFDLWYFTGVHYPGPERDFAAALEEDLEESEMISVTLRGEEDWSTYLSLLSSGELPAFLLGWWPDYMDPDNYLWPFGHSSQSGNLGIFYNDPDMDELLLSGRETTPWHSLERKGIYQYIQDMWADEAPTIPLLQGLNFAVVGESVHGVKPAYFELLPYFTLYQYKVCVPLVMRNY